MRALAGRDVVPAIKEVLRSGTFCLPACSCSSAEGGGGSSAASAAAAAGAAATSGSVAVRVADSESQTTDGKLWEPAAVLAAHLARLGDWHGVRVTELGCGLGMVGFTLAAQGAHVVLTDLPKAAVAVEAGVELNRRAFEAQAGAAVFQPLDWGDPRAEDGSLACEAVAIASDPVYDGMTLRLFVGCVASLFAGGGLDVLHLSHKHRPNLCVMDGECPLRRELEGAGLEVADVDLQGPMVHPYISVWRVSAL